MTDPSLLSTADLVEPELIAALAQDLGEEGVGEIMQSFREETEGLCAEIGAARTAEHAESLLHFLKGAALNLGLAPLADHATALEHAARTGQLPAPEEVERLSILRAASLAALGSRIAPG